MIAVRPNSACISRSSACSASAVRFVEIAGRFVGEQQRRLHHQRARNRDALLFAA